MRRTITLSLCTNLNTNPDSEQKKTTVTFRTRAVLPSNEDLTRDDVIERLAREIHGEFTLDRCRSLVRMLAANAKKVKND